MAQKINSLLAEDDKNLGVILKKYLEAKDIAVTLCSNGEEALQAFQAGDFNFCIFDVMMPLMDGFTLSKEIRKIDKRVPIIFLTAKTTQKDVIEGFKLGADDYITKPFSIMELKARVRALIRRAGIVATTAKEGERNLRFGELTLFPKTRLVEKNGQPVELTMKEFDLLEFLMEHPGIVYSREQLLSMVWEYDYQGEIRTVDVHVRRLREKLERDPAHPRYLITKRGVGYHFAEQG